MDVWYYLWNKPARVVAINEKEDLIVFKTEHINLERPQKLGLLDRGLILFRRNLAKRSRDFQRLGGARGCLKQEPDPAMVRKWARNHFANPTSPTLRPCQTGECWPSAPRDFLFLLREH